MATPWILYLLECTDGSLYTGITTNLEKRIQAHRTGKGSTYVASRGVDKIIATKSFPTKSEALKAEYAVKQLPKHKKEAWFTQPSPPASQILATENREEAFFRFIYLRQLIWYKRFVLKEPAPWTTDQLMTKYKIINMYRELDRCTHYIVGKLGHTTDREQLLLNTIVYRFFNWNQFYEELELPLLKPRAQDYDRLEQALTLRKQAGKRLFNNAYLIASADPGNEKYRTLIAHFRTLNVPQLIHQLDTAQTPAEAQDILQTIPLVGPFLAGEIWTDLAYYHFFPQGWTDDDYVSIGPGAAWGLEILYPETSPTEHTAKINHLHTLQRTLLPTIHTQLNEPLSWTTIAYPEASSNAPFLSRTNIEGALCEFRKYWNISHGKGRRKYFTPQKMNKYSETPEPGIEPGYP